MFTAMRYLLDPTKTVWSLINNSCDVLIINDTPVTIYIWYAIAPGCTDYPLSWSKYQPGHVSTGPMVYPCGMKISRPQGGWHDEKIEPGKISKHFYSAKTWYDVYIASGYSKKLENISNREVEVARWEHIKRRRYHMNGSKVPGTARNAPVVRSRGDVFNINASEILDEFYLPTIPTVITRKRWDVLASVKCDQQSSGGVVFTINEKVCMNESFLKRIKSCEPCDAVLKNIAKQFEQSDLSKAPKTHTMVEKITNQIKVDLGIKPKTTLRLRQQVRLHYVNKGQDLVAIERSKDYEVDYFYLPPVDHKT